MTECMKEPHSDVLMAKPAQNQEKTDEAKYYVIFVGAGREEPAEMFLRKGVSEGLCTSCFHPVRQMRRKIRGEWKDCLEKLIPGYVFIISEDVEGLCRELWKSPKFMKVLRREEGNPEAGVYALTEEETNWLETLAGTTKPEGESGQNPVIEISQVGFEENNKIVIVSGPLKDLEGKIKKINLHKRMAEVEVEFMNRKIVLNLGIEILGNKTQESIANTQTS